MTTPKSEFERELEEAYKAEREKGMCCACESDFEAGARWGCEWGYNHGKAVKDALYKLTVEENKELIKERDHLRTKVDRLEAENSKLRAALVSISKNSCCDTCQEAKLVALKALGGEE